MKFRTPTPRNSMERQYGQALENSRVKKFSTA
jgi:hypothetical protein